MEVITGKYKSQHAKQFFDNSRTRRNQMRNLIVAIFAVCTVLVLVKPALSEEFATKPEAEDIVKKAVAHVKNVGIEKAAEDFTNRKGEYVNRDLYVTVYNMQGDVLAHGQNRKSVGKNMMELKDPDGKYFVKERLEIARSKHSFWQEYKFTDPVSKRVLPKEMYCETVAGYVVCAGVYKR
jgi:cytochrome c